MADGPCSVASLPNPTDPYALLFPETSCSPSDMHVVDLIADPRSFYLSTIAGGATVIFAPIETDTITEVGEPLSNITYLINGEAVTEGVTPTDDDITVELPTDLGVGIHQFIYYRGDCGSRGMAYFRVCADPVDPDPDPLDTSGCHFAEGIDPADIPFEIKLLCPED